MKPDKRLFAFNAKTATATLVGGILFTLMFTYIKIPSGIPNTDIHTAYGLGAFLSAIFGSAVGAIIALAGHAISDFIQNGSPWWSWVIASGVSCFVTGLVYPKLKLEKQEFEKHDLIKFNLFQIVGNVFAWGIVAPILDIILYSEPAKTVFTQGIVAAISNLISTGVIGSALLAIYIEIKNR